MIFTRLILLSEKKYTKKKKKKAQIKRDGNKINKLQTLKEAL